MDIDAWELQKKQEISEISNKLSYRVRHYLIKVLTFRTNLLNKTSSSEKNANQQKSMKSQRTDLTTSG